MIHFVALQDGAHRLCQLIDVPIGVDVARRRDRGVPEELLGRLQVPSPPSRSPARQLPITRRSSSTSTSDDSAEPEAVVFSDDYGPTDNEFNGSVLWVQIDLGEDAEDADHLITAEERLRVAMARQ